MSKYDFALDMVTDNSNSVILRNIKSNSKILELGCAHGRMTRYMKEVLNCTIDTVEVDEEAGTIAANWARQSFAANVEDPTIWDELNEIGCNDYDYIIFADVLEHLHHPVEVLSKSKKLLKKADVNKCGGSIWISIPNTAHNAIIIDLMNNKFIYREVGLLDNTHIKLFTIHSILEMIEKAGLSLITRLDLTNPVGHTEFNNSYNDVPSEVANFLKKRELGEIYQFVMELAEE